MIPQDASARRPIDIMMLFVVMVGGALLLRKLAPIPRRLAVLAAAGLIFGILAAVIALIFWGTHFIEGTFITPLVRDESVDLPPLLTIFSTLAFTVVFGPSGVLLASPLVLIIITAVRVFYLEGFLGQPAPVPMTRGHGWPFWRPPGRRAVSPIAKL